MPKTNSAKKKTSGSKKKSSSKKKKKSSGEVGRWNGHKFIVSSKLIRGLSDLTIKGGSDTEDKEKNKQYYVSRKNGKPTEISFTASLHALTGCKVRTEALAFVKDAKEGKKDYLYIGRKKLVPYKMLLVDATVKEVEIAANRRWIRAKVQLSLKQTGTGGKSVSKKKGTGNGGSSSGGGSQKTSVKASSPVITGGQKASTTAPTKEQTTKDGLSEINRITSNAKKYSSTKKKSGGWAVQHMAAR